MRTVKVVTKHGEKIDLYSDYHALVVGISNYEKWPKLPNAANDAKEVAEKLRELGFEIKLVLNPTSREMKTALNEMVYEMGKEVNRALLFYYAGHGETETLADRTNMGYIIPKDCPRLADNPLGFATHAISMRDIESASLRTRSKHVMMLFDSCFSGALFALVRAVPHDITEKSALPVRQYITAGREDEQVPDKSMFKRCLLIGLDGDADLTGDGYITGSELGMYLSDKVVNYTHRRQHPQYGKINNPDLDRGDFIFLPLESRQKEEVTQQKAQGEEMAVTEELRKLREERKKSEELVKKLERLLEAKQRSEDREKEILAKKSDLEKKLKEAEEEAQTNKGLEARKIKELEAERKAAEERARREAAKRKAREKEIAEGGQISEGRRELANRPKKRVAYAVKSDEEKINELYEKRLMLRENPSLAKEIYTPDAVREITNPFGKTRTISGLPAIVEYFENRKGKSGVSDRKEISRKIKIEGDKAYMEIVDTGNILDLGGKCEIIRSLTLVKTGNNWRVKHAKTVIR
jgi:uncharacterized caspase-like protein